MGCFLGCFGGPKERKRRKAVHRIPSRSREIKVPENSRLLQAIADPARLPQHIEIGPTLKPPPQTPSQPLPVETPVADSNFQLRPEEGEKAAFSSQRKKVTFDLNVTTYEQIPVANDSEIESSIEVPKREEEEVEEEEEEEEEEEKEKNTREEGALNHRYQNCVADDDDDYDYDEDDDSDEEEDEGEEEVENEEEESYDSYFSLQFDKEKQQAFNEVSSPAKPAPPPAAAGKCGGGARDRSQYVHSVLNPVENLSQWKSVATKTSPQTLKTPRKENLSLLEREAELPKRRNQKVSVDASLSNWLSTNNSPCGSNSSITREERPILGALTVEDLSKSPKSSPSPRKSPIQRSPEDIPILGTVGSYWSSSENSVKGIPNTTSKYREDRRVNWHSTPFEVRLERTLNRGNAEAY